MHLSNFSRLFFSHLPTRLEPLNNISKKLGGPTIWIKRDDCTGLAGGGNKTRKLEFLMADAVNKNATAIITQGATQSNHVRQTAAISAKLNLKCFVLLEDRTGFSDVNHNYNGNVLLDSLFGATIERRPGGSDMQKEMERYAEKLRQEQHLNPYIIVGGGSNAIGALGYVNCAMEIVSQANDMGLKIDSIVHATGSAGTQAGLVTGIKALNAKIPVLGIGVRLSKEDQEAKVLECAEATAQLLNLDSEIPPEEVVANCDYVGEGYGIPSQGTIDAINMLAQEEGILLDPVYSGKSFAGLIDLIAKGYFANQSNLIFVHTGGSQALSGYVEYFI